MQNECHHEFEDKHEKSEIYDYFKNIKADTPKHLKYLIIEIMIELSIIGILEKIKKDYVTLFANIRKIYTKNKKQLLILLNSLTI